MKALNNSLTIVDFVTKENPAHKLTFVEPNLMCYNLMLISGTQSEKVVE